jgi:hypothetical protein
LGFRYYRLAPSLLEKDQFGNWVISKKFNPAVLAEAVCKLQGFVYAPSDTLYWQHGHSTERDFIYVTTQTLNLRGSMLHGIEEYITRPISMERIPLDYLVNPWGYARIIDRACDETTQPLRVVPAVEA